MSGKHTPGPWSVVQEETWPFGISIEPDVVAIRRIAYSTADKSLKDVRDANGFPHCDRERISELVARQEADARLIAAAPDLLAALEQALLHIERDEVAHGRNFAAGNVSRAAIAKARGEA